VHGEPWHGVDQDGRELVQAVEDKAVLPHHYGQHEDAHGQDIVGLQYTSHVSHHALTLLKKLPTQIAVDSCLQGVYADSHLES
jgi:hypothetical protein